MSESPTSSHPPRAARWGPWKLSPRASSQRALKLLLLHGFCSSPRELRPLGQALSQRGYSCLAPLLPGHGEGPVGMRACILEDWLEAVQLSFESLHRDGSPVAVVGFCLGSLLGLATAPELSPRGLVCLAPPSGSHLREFFELTDEEDFYSSEAFLKNCQSPTAQNWRTMGAHRKVPGHFLERFEEAIERAEEQRRSVRCPIFLAHGDHAARLSPAPATPPENHPSSKLCRVSRAGYALPIDHGRRELFKQIATFLEELESLDRLPL